MGRLDELFADEVAPQRSKLDELFDDAQPAVKTGALRTLGDAGLTAVKSAIGATEVAVGVADMPTGGYAGKAAEAIGYRPKEATAMLDEWYSPEKKAKQAVVDQAEGFWDTAGAYARNPSILAHTVGESLGPMGGGALIARGALKLAPKMAPFIAGAIGEGAAGMGSAAEHLRQNSDDGLLSGKQALSAVGSGAVTGALGALGGKIANKYDLGDVDTMLASGAVGASKKGMVRQTLESGLSEGVLEELPQSMQEQMWQNYATGKPLMEGVAKAGASGMMAGVAMGGVAGGVRGAVGRGQSTDETGVPDELQPQDLIGLPSPGRTVGTGTSTGDILQGESSRENAYGVNEAYAEYVQAQRNAEEQRRNSAWAQYGDEYSNIDVMGNRTAPAPTGDGSQAIAIPTQGAGSAQHAEHFEHPLVRAVSIITQAARAAKHGNPVEGQFAEDLEWANAALKAEVGEEGYASIISRAEAEASQAPTTKGKAAKQPATVTPESPAPGAVIQPTAQPVAPAVSPLYEAFGLNPKKKSAETVAKIVARADALLATNPEVDFAGLSQALAKSKFQAARKILDGLETAQRTQTTTDLSATPVVSIPTLAPVQQKVMDTLVRAQRSNVLDSYVDAKGTIQYEKIANDLNLQRGSVLKAIQGMRKAISAASGMDVRQYLEAQAKDSRVTEMPDTARLGLSPEHQLSQVDTSALFGNPEAGADPSMGEISSIGGSQSETSSASDAVAEQQARKAMEQYPPMMRTALSERLQELGANYNAMFPEERLHLLQVGKDRDITAEDVTEARRLRQVMRGEDTAETTYQTAQEGASQDMAEAKRVAEAKANARQAALDNAVTLASADAKTASVDWNDAKTPGAPTFEELTDAAQADFVVEYRDQIQLISDAWDDIEAFVQGFEKSLEPSDVRRSENTGQELPAAVSGGGSRTGEDQGTRETDAPPPQAKQPTVVTKKRRVAAQPDDGQISEIDVKHSVGTNTQGQTAATLTAKLLKAFSSPYFFNRAVAVVQTDDALPAGLQSSDSVVQAVYDPKNNKVWMVAGNIAEGQELAVLLHEVGVHMGMKNLLGPENYAKLLKQVQAWAETGTGKEGEIARAALARVKNAEAKVGTQAEDELLAYFVEEAVNAGVDPTAKQHGTLQQWFRTLWAAAKAAIRKLGMNPEKLTTQNVVDLAYGAARMELNASWHGTAAEFRKFDHAYMNTGEGAQAFGWGTYLAQKLGIGKTYWRQDVARKVEAQSVFDAPNSLTPAELSLYEYVLDTPSMKLRSSTSPDAKAQFFYEADRLQAAPYVDEATLDSMLAKVRTHVQPSGPDGNLMRVDTSIQDDELLDWDKPLSEQSEKVRKILAAKGHTYGEYDSSGAGRDLYADLTDRFDGDKEASKYLDSIGIKGIKFLDADSRGSDKAFVTAGGKKLKVTSVTEQDALYQLMQSSGDINATIRQLKKDKAASHESLVDMGMEEDIPGSDARFDMIVDVLNNWSALGAEYGVEPETRNIVVFNDKNIQRIFSEPGANKDARKFSVQSTIEANVAKLPPSLRDSSLKLATNLNDLAQKGIMALTFGHDLARMVSKLLPSASKYYDLYGQKESVRNDMETKIDDLMTAAYRLPKGERTKLKAFLKSATSKATWYRQPEWLVDKDGKQITVKVDDAAKTAYGQLLPETRQLADQMFEHGYTSRMRLIATVKDAINADFDAELKAASEADKAKIQERRLLEMRRFNKQFPTIQGPYAPLSRFGNYVSIGRSQAMVDAEKDSGTVNAEDLADMKMDPKHFRVYFHDTLGDALLSKQQMEQDFGPDNTTYSAKETYSRSMNEAPWSALRRLKIMLNAQARDSGKEDKATLAKVNQLMNDLYLSTLAEHSARAHDNKRGNVTGADEDMLRSFASKGKADANFMAALLHNGEIQDTLSAMRGESKAGADRAEKTRALNEILQRHAASLDYRPTPIQDKFLALNSFMMLVTKPSYYLQQAAQPFMMSLPMLAGKHGYFKSWKVLTRAYKDMARAFGTKGIAQGFYEGTFDIDAMPISGDEKTMLHTLKKLGVLDIGINKDMGYWESRGGGTQIVADVSHKFSTLIRQMEAVNRVSTALAAYRLAGGGERGARDAKDLIDTTHGNYNASDAPSLFNKLPPLVTQFRKFQLIQLAFFVRMMHQAFKGASPEEKAVARAQLGYTLGHYGVMAGALGMPMINLVGMAAGLALGGGDEPPEDIETRARKAIGNEDIANLLLKGVPAFFGADTSGSLGAGNMTSILPFTNVDPTTKKGQGELAMGIAGPFIGGTLVNFGVGIGLIQQGDIYKGFEKMVPSGLTNAMKAYRYQNEGLTNKLGDVTLSSDEMSLWTSMVQLTGLRPTQVANVQLATGNAIETKMFFAEKSSAITHKYTSAYKDGDYAEMQELRDQWQALQQGRMDAGFTRQPLSTLIKAPMEQRKRERQSTGGVQWSKQNRGFVQKEHDEMGAGS